LTGGILTRLLVTAVLLLGIAPAWAQAPQRVVTVNLCLDQLALRLAAPGQLAGVSWLSRDPRLSVLADRARAVAPVRASAESILDLRPDLVIFDDAAHATVKRLLRGAGVRVFEVPWAASLDDAEVLIARMAAALGRDAAGQALVADMREQRRRLTWQGPPTATAAVLQANRGTAGRGSLMDELLRLTGFRNLAAELGIAAYGRLPLESVLAGRPDVLVLDGAVNANPARATEFVDHHALLSLAGQARLVSMPMKYSICAGPENFDAMRLLVEARRAIGEFQYDADESGLAVDLAALSVTSPRGALHIGDLGDAEFFALVDDNGRTREIAFCSSRLGARRTSIHELDETTFDLGIGAPHVDMMVRLRDDDAATRTVLRHGAGRPLLAPGNPAGPAISRSSPTRIFVSALARLEVYQPIPPPGGRSPEGPHSHLVPKYLQESRAHAPGSPLPAGLYCGLSLYPRTRP
jgi:iron complex transport system substrate-binding protein